MAPFRVKGQPQGAVKRHRRPGVEGCVEGEGLGWAVWLPRGPRVRAMAEMARFRGLPLVASVRVRLPWSMRVCLRAHCQGLGGWPVVCPPWGSSGEQQVREIQLLLVVGDGGDGGLLRVAASSSRRCLLPSMRIPVSANCLKRANSSPCCV